MILRLSTAASCSSSENATTGWFMASSLFAQFQDCRAYFEGQHNRCLRWPHRLESFCFGHAYPGIASRIPFRTVTHLIMSCIGFNTTEQRETLGMKYCNRVIRTGIALHGFNGVKKVEHDKFNFCRSILSQQIARTMALNLFDFRQSMSPEDGLIGIRIF